MQYKMENCSVGRKNEKVVGSGVAIFAEGNLIHQLQYKLANRRQANQTNKNEPKIIDGKFFSYL